MKHFLFTVFQFLTLVTGVGLTIAVALQTSKSEGLSGILAGGGGGGGKVGRDKQLEDWSTILAYSWLVLAVLAGITRGH